jgi:splicing factor 3B subunit 2
MTEKRLRRRVKRVSFAFDPKEDSFEKNPAESKVQLVDDIPDEFLQVMERFKARACSGTGSDLESESGDEASESVAYSETDSLDNASYIQDKVSKKRIKLESRPSVSQLKQQTSRPEVVESTDITAPDPLLLVTLKSLPNTIPVPGHWSQKRKYLQGKRGYEKPPFELPAYIKDTGIMEQRQATAEREAAKGLKAKTRERLLPKLGKIHLDYERLHDAFFRFQTKPRMTAFGDLYYEGKEFEKRFENIRPGMPLSDELQLALGILTPERQKAGGSSTIVPPPWLVQMQRYGPPPSYPHLKIPGLNAPIPPGAQWGYQPGGWGKVPVNEYGQLLYGGDVFNTQSSSSERSLAKSAPISFDLWGSFIYNDIESYQDQSSDSEDSEKEIDEEPHPLHSIPIVINPVVATAITATATERDSLSQLKKEIRSSLEEPQLYTVIPKEHSRLLLSDSDSKDSFLKPSHTYIVNKQNTEPKPTLAEPVSTKNSPADPKKPAVKRKEFKF